MARPHPVDREKRGVWVYYRARTQASLGTLIGSPAR